MSSVGDVIVTIVTWTSGCWALSLRAPPTWTVCDCYCLPGLPDVGRFRTDNRAPVAQDTESFSHTKALTARDSGYLRKRHYPPSGRKHAWEQPGRAARKEFSCLQDGLG